MNETDRDELLELANSYLEQSLSAEEAARLESILESNEEARRCFVDFTHDHAALHWEQISSAADEIEELSDYRPRRLPTMWQTLAAAAVISLLALALVKPQPKSEDFATMTRTAAARWESGPLPTMNGARLGAGTLKLVRGLATIQFDSGAEVVLEAPAELELVDAMNCVLTRGTAVAEVSEGAEGFMIKTPTANVIDHGTRFAVNVNPSTGGTQTQVFDGLVEVELPATGESIELHRGQRNFVAGQELGDASEGLEEATWAPSSLPRHRKGNWVEITTADPGGDDGYVWGGEPNNHVSDELLLLKHSQDRKGPHRKSYLKFNLGPIESGAIKSAELNLRFTPTGWGLASHVDDSRFNVFGLTADNLDNWTHNTLKWENAPANDTNTGTTLQKEAATLLGSFQIPQGLQSGTFGIRGEKLVNFLNQDENRSATIVIVRETIENSSGGLVHAFASARHPNLPAPTLTLQVK
ncbi:MAG: DNRLRE domain-containing protein [Verrucomicrobiales bacterium]|nr:DNRLRE domain-containing protein [Verrucomicrobiales bacterium]